MALSQQPKRILILAISTGTTVLGSACALDRSGKLEVSDAGSAIEPAAEAADNRNSPDSTDPVADLDATIRVSGDESAAQPDMGVTDALFPDASGPGDEPEVDASSTNTSPGDVATGDEASGDGSSVACDFNGTWASRLVIDVSWVPQGLTGVILAPGSGQIKQWILATRIVSGQAATDTTVVCGIVLPDFSGTQIAGGEKYGVEFPNSIFDQGILPAFSVDGTIVGGGSGATYTTVPSAALLGMTLPNATTAPWPATITTEVDSDQDGKPGVTAFLEQGGGYSPAPVDTLGGRADRLYVAIRQVTAVSATALDCDAFGGTVTIPKIADSASTPKYAIDSHVIGCSLIGDGGDCAASQTRFVDTTQPVFSPSGSTSFASVRVASGATCATARQRLP